MSPGLEGALTAAIAGVGFALLHGLPFPEAAKLSLLMGVALAVTAAYAEGWPVGLAFAGLQTFIVGLAGLLHGSEVATPLRPHALAHAREVPRGSAAYES